MHGPGQARYCRSGAPRPPRFGVRTVMTADDQRECWRTAPYPIKPGADLLGGAPCCSSFASAARTRGGNFLASWARPGTMIDAAYPGPRRPTAAPTEAAADFAGFCQRIGRARRLAGQARSRIPASRALITAAIPGPNAGVTHVCGAKARSGHDLHAIERRRDRAGAPSSSS